MEQMDLIELNEAFAAQALAVLREWNLPDGLERVNVNGSGISLGHPIGATGARILATLLHELDRRQGRYGLETMCIGGGQGLAAIFERVAVGVTTGRPRDEETLAEVIEALAPLERRAGSDGERQAAEWIAARLTAAGSPAQVEPAQFREGYPGLLSALSGAGAVAGVTALASRRRAGPQAGWPPRRRRDRRAGRRRLQRTAPGSPRRRAAEADLERGRLLRGPGRTAHAWSCWPTTTPPSPAGSSTTGPSAGSGTASRACSSARTPRCRCGGWWWAARCWSPWAPGATGAGCWPPARRPRPSVWPPSRTSPTARSSRAPTTTSPRWRSWWRWPSALAAAPG